MVFTAPANVGANEVTGHVFTQNTFCNSECSLGIFGLGCSFGGLGEWGVAVLAIGVGFKIAAGFGLNVSRCFGCIYHRLNQITVNVVSI